MKINHEFLITATNPGIKVSTRSIHEVISEVSGLDLSTGITLSREDSQIYLSLSGVNEGKITSLDWDKYTAFSHALELISRDEKITIDSYVLKGKKFEKRDPPTGLVDQDYRGNFTIKLENYSRDIGSSPLSKFAAQNRNRLHSYGIKCTIDYEGGFEGAEVVKTLQETIEELYQSKQE